MAMTLDDVLEQSGVMLGAGKLPTADQLVAWREAIALHLAGMGEPVAWLSADGRVVTARQKTDSVNIGGASASSMDPYVLPAYTAPPASVDVASLQFRIAEQDAEIARLSQKSAQRFIRGREWAGISGRMECRAINAESRLAAADALLREIYDYGEDLALHARIAAHLSENAHDRA